MGKIWEFALWFWDLYLISGFSVEFSRFVHVSLVCVNGLVFVRLVIFLVLVLVFGGLVLFWVHVFVECTVGIVEGRLGFGWLGTDYVNVLLP